MKFLIYLFILLSATSCSVRKFCTERYCTNDSVTVIIRDTIRVQLPNDTIVLSVNLDSLKQAIELSTKKEGELILYKDSVVELTGIYNRKTNELRFKIKNLKPKIVYIPIEIKKAVPILPKKVSYLGHVQELRFTLLIVFVAGLILGLYLQFKKQ
jgi:hypothetical protein